MDTLGLDDPRIVVLANIRIPVWVFDVDHSRIIWANDGALSYWRASSLADIRARDLAADMSVSVRERLQQIRTEAVNSGKPVSEYWTLYPDGIPRTAESVMSAFDLPDGRVALLLQIIYEDNEATSETLHSAQALMHTSAMISLYNSDLALLYSNPAARSVACSESQPLSAMLIHESDLEYVQREVKASGSCDLEAEVQTCHGRQWHSLNVRASPDRVSGKPSILVSTYDITDRRKAQRDAYLLAHTDSLTGLANRMALLQHVESLCTGDNSPFALLFLDLDRFKVVNDSLGHTIGDALLKAVADRLKKCTSHYPGLVSRLGGDEFVIVLERPANEREVAALAQKVLNEMDAGFNIEGHQMAIVPSVGVCLYPLHGESATALMKNADVAMYVAKSMKAGYRFFDSRMNADLENRLQLESDLTSAIRQQEFSVYYQPKILSRTGRVSGMEALIRWFHPQRGIVSPLEFISIAEETGKIISIGDWVMRQAMQQQVAWVKAGHEVCVSINVSAIQINSHGFVESVVENLAQTGCKASSIELEITESLLLSDSGEVLDILQKLDKLGIRLSIDDFGTGYSNLAYLQRYPLSGLKIDRAFLADMGQTAILETILRMGKTLGLSVVAEGVETAQQLQWLQRHGCDELQGYFFSKPLPAEQACDYLASHRPKALATLRVA